MPCDSSTTLRGRFYLEPGLLCGLVSPVELGVGFGEVDDPLDEGNDGADPAEQEQDHDDPLGCVAQVKFMYP